MTSPAVSNRSLTASGIPSAGAAYLAVALLLGALFLRFAWRLRRETTTARAGALFRYSLLYLALLFVALAIDPLL